MAEANKEQRIGVDLGLVVEFQIPPELSEDLTSEACTYALRQTLQEYLSGLLFQVPQVWAEYDKTTRAITIKMPPVPAFNQISREVN